MKLHNLQQKPEGYTYDGEIDSYEAMDEEAPCEIDSFSSMDIENLLPLNLDEAWYWYVTGFYNGAGQILMRKGDLYDIHDCAHGANSPLEAVKFSGKPLSELKANVSPELMIQLKPLFDAAENAHP